MVVSGDVLVTTDAPMLRTGAEQLGIGYELIL
jgi:hypothetical protein